MEEPMSSEKPKGNTPVHEIPDGAIKLSIWKNKGEHGAFYSVTCRRRYKDGDEWKDTNSYGEDDVLLVSKLF